jgi:hypothetical protein
MGYSLMKKLSQPAIISHAAAEEDRLARELFSCQGCFCDDIPKSCFLEAGCNMRLL